MLAPDPTEAPRTESETRKLEPTGGRISAASPHRSFLIFVAFLVAAGSLLIQGTTLNLSVKLIRPREAGEVNPEEHEELRAILRGAVRTATPPQPIQDLLAEMDPDADSEELRTAAVGPRLPQFARWSRHGSGSAGRGRKFVHQGRRCQLTPRELVGEAHGWYRLRADSVGCLDADGHTVPTEGKQTMSRCRTTLATSSLAAVLLLAGCSVAASDDTAATSTSETAAVESTTQETASATDHSVAAEQSTVNTSATSELVDVDWDSLPTTEVELTDDGLTITEAGTYVLTGESAGQVAVDTDGYVRLILDGVTINSAEGAAIQIDNAELAVIELADGATNTISDSATRSDEDIDGAIYSSDGLVITGTGTLDMTANFADGVVGKDDLWIESGTINVTSVDDGIRGKDSLNISGGTITIDAQGDGMKSSNDTDLGLGQLNITGGDITITTGDDAIKAEQALTISGGTIEIVSSVEGIEAPVIVIDGGDITINASDDGINASASDIVLEGLGITINDGTLDITMGAGDTDAIDSNGDLTVNGGTLNITAQSAFDYDGTGTLTGGTINVNGEAWTELTQTGPGAGMGGPGGGPGGGQPGGDMGGPGQNG